MLRNDVGITSRGIQRLVSSAVGKLQFYLIAKQIPAQNDRRECDFFRGPDRTLFHPPKLSATVFSRRSPVDYFPARAGERKRENTVDAATFHANVPCVSNFLMMVSMIVVLGAT